MQNGLLISAKGYCQLLLETLTQLRTNERHTFSVALNHTHGVENDLAIVLIYVVCVTRVALFK